MTDTQTVPVEASPGSGVDASRPFGAHLRMSWWKPLVLIAVVSVGQLALQVTFYLVTGLIEGSDDPLSATFTPLKFLAANLSIGATGVLAVLLLVWMTGAPWRTLVSFPRAFDARRLRQYLVGAALLVGAAIGVVALVAPEAPGWTTFGISSTTIALLAVMVVSTPLSAGEELMFRSAVLPAAASWVRAVRPALVVGLVVSSLGFAGVHGSTDPWLFGYYVAIGVCTGLMAIISGGVEAPVAFHRSTRRAAAAAAGHGGGRARSLVSCRSWGDNAQPDWTSGACCGRWMLLHRSWRLMWSVSASPRPSAPRTSPS